MISFFLPISINRYRNFRSIKHCFSVQFLIHIILYRYTSSLFLRITPITLQIKHTHTRSIINTVNNITILYSVSWILSTAFGDTIDLSRLCKYIRFHTVALKCEKKSHTREMKMLNTDDPHRVCVVTIIGSIRTIILHGWVAIDTGAEYPPAIA